MGLGALTDVVGPERVIGIPVGEVTALAYDSRAVVPGHALLRRSRRPRGRPRIRAAPAVDGGRHRRRRRARAGRASTVPQLVVDRTRRALADAADEWFGRPSEQLKVIGVTGTDGKSTVTGPHGRDALGLPLASRPDRHGLHRHLRRPRAQPRTQHDAGGARAAGAAGPDGRSRQRQRGHGGHIARAGAGADPQLPLRRRRGDDRDQRAPRVPRHASRTIGRPRRS